MQVREGEEYINIEKRNKLFLHTSQVCFNTYWSTLSGMLTVFERIVNILGVQLDRGWVRGPGLQGKVHEVGGREPLLPSPALPSRSVARSEKLVVVELVTPGPSVPLVLGHRVGNRLLHINVHLGSQHGHVVAWQEMIDQYKTAANMM